MARILTRTLFRFKPLSPSLSFSLRHFSAKPQVMEIDLGASSSPSSSLSLSDSEAVAREIKLLEDTIQRIIVQRFTPDWLPFMPGSSFWVPARSNKFLNVDDLVSKLANLMTEDEQLSLTTVRGWPSSEFFIPDGLPSHEEVKVVVVEVPTTSENISSGSDEER